VDVIVYVEIKATIPVLIDVPGWDGDDDEEAMRLALAEIDRTGQLCEDTLRCCRTHSRMDNVQVKVAESGPGRCGFRVVPADERPGLTR
jgi:hypothetical protein